MRNVDILLLIDEWFAFSKKIDEYVIKLGSLRYLFCRALCFTPWLPRGGAHFIPRGAFFYEFSIRYSFCQFVDGQYVVRPLSSRCSVVVQCLTEQ
ncbi:MAG: hypothetical protein IJQ14_04125, partial [Bacteroidales bacterium]|nr:hypothetical protein [Bacteroidales bacterium]